MRGRGSNGSVAIMSFNQTTKANRRGADEPERSFRGEAARSSIPRAGKAARKRGEEPEDKGNLIFRGKTVGLEDKPILTKDQGGNKTAPCHCRTARGIFCFDEMGTKGKPKGVW